MLRQEHIYIKKKKKIKNVSPGPILEVKKAVMIKDWKVLLHIELLHKNLC